MVCIEYYKSQRLSAAHTRAGTACRSKNRCGRYKSADCGLCELVLIGLVTRVSTRGLLSSELNTQKQSITSVGLSNLSMMKPWRAIPKLTGPLDYDLEIILSLNPSIAHCCCLVPFRYKPTISTSTSTVTSKHKTSSYLKLMRWSTHVQICANPHPVPIQRARHIASTT